MESKVVSCLLITLLLSTSAAADTYRWKDESGKLHFSSAVLAEYAEQPYDIMSKSSLVIGRVERGSQSVEARIEVAKQKALSEKSIEERQAQLDGLLLIKYPTEVALVKSLQLVEKYNDPEDKKVAPKETFKQTEPAAKVQI